MRNTLILSGILLLMVVAYFLFIHEKDGTSLDVSETAFAMEDTSRVDMLVLEGYTEGNPDEKIVLMKNAAGDWVLNDSLVALEKRVRILLGTLAQLQVREALVGQGRTAGLKLLDRRHVRVRAFRGKRKVKDIFVGTEMKDQRGTLMKLDGAKWPYIVEIPGFQGYLNTRFSLDIQFWRENLLFDGRLANIRSVASAYPDESQSFEISRSSAASSWLLNAGSGTVDSLRLQEYLDQFTSKVYALAIAEDRYPGQREVLKANPPMAVFTVSYFDRDPTRIVIYPMEENRENFFGWIEGQERLLVIQKFVFSRFLRERSFFLKNDPV
jgi:hypothetical protein